MICFVPFFNCLHIFQSLKSFLVESKFIFCLFQFIIITKLLFQELVRQGEVLKRTEKRVDKMEQDLKESDRHLRSIKSLWGAFMNKFSKEPTPTKPMSFDEEDGQTPDK